MVVLGLHRGLERLGRVSAVDSAADESNDDDVDAEGVKPKPIKD